jgi:DNA primase
MINVNGMEIDTTYQQLLIDLKGSLMCNGIFLLNDIKPTGDNIMITCPVHKDGHEHKPSCGVSIVPKYQGSKIIEPGTVHCFTCGYTAPLTSFISNCFGYKDGGIFGNKWIKAQYNTGLTPKTRKVELNLSRRTITRGELPNVPEEVLQGYRFTVNYMYSRGLTDDIIEQFDIGYDRKDDCITIPVPNLKGEVKWLQRRSIIGKRYYIPSGINKTDYLLGASEVLRLKLYKQPVYIVESPFNMLTLWKLGLPAICIFGTGGGNQYKMLNKLPIRHYIIALDPDEAGKKGSRKLLHNLGKTKLLSKVNYIDQRDINELDTEFKKLKISPINL